MIPYCVDSGIASIHWSPLAKGLLIGKNRDTVRKNTDIIAPQLFGDRLNDNDDAIIDRVLEIAEKYNRSPAQVNGKKKLLWHGCLLNRMLHHLLLA
ncbi:hypothetical protein G6F47_013899 [Rhizopus delemar]|nr:hypothetical protein G6F49_013857 [Rhizopus delemar]KAG1564705.1 hypothetical protein G6F48_013821 [Rhizopus delemar]KAG1565332.1 hypothetical protein G6F47_013899 [Rhizopus delemar]KAG1606035.1 hypothetical protein G6F44_013891 [Rhizopus delemar]